MYSNKYSSKLRYLWNLQLQLVVAQEMIKPRGAFRLLKTSQPRNQGLPGISPNGGFTTLKNAEETVRTSLQFLGLSI